MNAATAPLLLLRADAGPGIGNGHVLRDLALAEVWLRRRGRARLVTAALPDDVRGRVEAAGVDVEWLPSGLDADAFRAAVEAASPAWVVLDGYGFEEGYQAAAAVGGSRVLVIDDHGSRGSYRADLVLDQNLGADPSAYANRTEAAGLLLGPRYALLREEFRTVGRRPRSHATVERLLVTLGGAPPDEALAAVEEAVRLAGAAGVATFAGGGRPVRDLARVASEADAALSAAGSTVWELAALGLPMLLVPIAGNQDRVAAQMAAAGAALAVERGAPADAIAAPLRRLLEDAGLRAELARAAAALVDGNGARRVATAMKARLIDLRPAEPGDAERLWAWANDPAVRRSAFQQDDIPWADHQAWFARRLASPDSRIRVAVVGGQAVGQIRFDRDPATAEAEVDVSVAAERRGEGWAPALIARASADALSTGWCRALHAWVKADNPASQAAFAEAGYDAVEEPVQGARQALHYARREA